MTISREDIEADLLITLKLKLTLEKNVIGIEATDSKDGNGILSNLDILLMQFMENNDQEARNKLAALLREGAEVVETGDTSIIIRKVRKDFN